VFVDSNFRVKFGKTDSTKETFAMADDNVDKLYQIYDVLSTAGDKIKEVRAVFIAGLFYSMSEVFVGIFTSVVL